ncbi:MAG: S8 family serine peptidase, partial [Sedimentisphaerales bacterium]|nr:S8 family serine peptidase [Sedimentisphaerales bacterium]
MFKLSIGKGLLVFVALSLVCSSICPAGDVKISGAISAHMRAKERSAGVSAFEHAKKLRRMGLNPANLSGEDCALYVDEPLRRNEIARLRNQGIVVHDIYVPAVAGKHDKGFHLATVSYSALDFIRNDARFARLESVESANKPLNDLAAAMTKVDLVHAGTGVDARTGLGVKIAVADSGLDLSHGDIPTPIEALDVSGTGPWDSDVTNLVTAHGTHVVGSAVGSGALSGGQYIGMAPGADLYFYKIGDDVTASAGDSDMIEAITRAQSLGCDIFSMSYGGYSVFMDGSGAVCQTIDAAAAAGMTCFIAAGNEQDNRDHYSVEVAPGAVSGTFVFTINNSGPGVYASDEWLQLNWIDGADDENIILTCTNLGASESLVEDWSGCSPRGTESKQYVLSPSVPSYSTKTYTLSFSNSAGSGVTPDVHIYHISGNGYFNVAETSSTILYPALADDAIAVGAWTQRKLWKNYEGIDYYYPILTVDTLAPFSSLGPRIDGVLKPDVVAPGAATISARDSYGSLAASDARIVDNDGLNLDGSGPADYYVNMGTSMACPHAAGLAALVLEAKPSLTPAELKQTLTSTASNAYGPNNSVGYGMLNVYDAIVSDEPVPNINPITMKGVSYTAWDSNSLSTADSDASIAQAHDDGCNWIAICVWEFQDTATSTVIAPDYDSYSATPESVAEAIGRCHELGMNVMLKPMVDCLSCSWRGEIQPSTEWFAAYQSSVDRWAQVARDNSVEMFSVGCELRDTVSWSASWRDVISNVRTIYSGPVVYSANHGNEQNIDWWDAVDFIGIDAYYALTGTSSPSPDTLKATWSSRLDSIESWRNANWASMDIIFTEVGYQSTDGTNRTPWYTDPGTNPIDLLEQSDCYEALLSQCRERDWWLGAFWWNWETDPNAGGASDPYWTPQNKPAEVILADYYEGAWRWNDDFIAVFVDAEGINRHPGSTYPGEQFDGQVVSVTDTAGAGVEVVYSLVDGLGDPVDNSVAGLEVWKPDGANWRGQGPSSGLRLVEQWGSMLNMDASPFERLEVPVSYISGAGALDVRAFCVTGTSSGEWEETQLDSQVVMLLQGQSAVLTIDLTSSPDITRMVKVGVVVEAHDGVMEGEQASLRIGATTSQMAVVLENYGAGSSYRWKDVAGQLYSAAYQSSYTYDDADVQVSFNTVDTTLRGRLTASNLKPNFAYQFKLIGTPIHQLGDTNYGTNELIGLNGRWWQQEWLGGSWSGGGNLNSKGDGSSPNPNDLVYAARRDTADTVGGSPTGLQYRYSGYRVFDYFITDEYGSATLDFEIDSCYHVLFGTWQGSPGVNDGPLVSHSFDVDPAEHAAYDTDYGPATAGVWGEWERLPMGGVGLREGHYKCDLLLTEESFHESGLGGNWAHAMHGAAEFDIGSSMVLLDEDFGDGDYLGWTIVDEGDTQGPSSW